MTRAKRILLSFVVAACVGFALICAVLASLPGILSTQSVQAGLKTALSSSFKRSVAWSSLDASWSEGLSLSGFRLGPGPAPLLTLDMAEVIIVPSIGRGRGGRYGLGLYVRVKDVQAAAAPGTAKPPLPKLYKDPLTLMAEGIRKLQELDLPLPLDLRVDVDVAPVRLVYADQVKRKNFALEGLTFRWDMPSLAASPVHIRADGVLSAMGKRVGRTGINAKISGLVIGSGRINPASAFLEADGSLPGASITLRGGLKGANGLQLAGNFDLSRLHDAAYPFLSPDTPVPHGMVTLDLKAQVDPLRDLHATLTLQGQQLSATGGAVKSGAVDPLDMRLSQQIDSNHKGGLVRFTAGELSVPGILDAKWSGRVKDPSGRGRRVDMTVGPVTIDLQKTLKVAEPFFPRKRKQVVTDLKGTVSLKMAAVHLEGSGNDGGAEIEGLAADLPRLLLTLPAGRLGMQDLRVELERAAFPLKGGLPSELTALLACSVEQFSLAGKEPVAVKGLRSDLDVVVKELNLKSGSPRRVTLSADLNHTLECDEGRVGSRVSVNKLHERLQVGAKMGEQGDIAVSLPKAGVSIGEVCLSRAGKKIPPFPVVARLSADSLRLPPKGKGKPEIRNVKVEVTGGTFLNLVADAALSASEPQVVSTSGKTRVDLGLFAPIAAPLLPKGIAAKGTADVSWKVSAPMPGRPVPGEKNPLRAARAVLALVNDGEVAVSTSDLDLNFPAGKGALFVKGVTTDEPLRFSVAGKGESVLVAGGIRLEEIGGLPGKAGELPVRRCSLNFKGNLSEWKDLRFNEELRVDSLGMNQVGELTIDRIDPLLHETGKLSLQTLLRRLDIAFFTNLDASFSPELRPLLAGVDVAGKISAGGRLNLAAGRDLRILAYAQSRDFGLHLRNGTTLEGIRSDLVLDRLYALAMPRGDGWIPLSAGLVRPIEVARPDDGSADIARRIGEDLRGEVRGERTFRVRKIMTRLGELPLVVNDLEGDLRLDLQAAGLGFLQGDLLGGTVRAQGIMDMRREVPVLAAALSFTNLDASLLVPVKPIQAKASEKIDSEISGEMTLDAPLTNDQRDFLEGMRMNLSVHRVGSRTLERALYSLDPYERNEQIISQRRLLRLGGVKWFRAATVDGAMNVEGEALVKGSPLRLPSVDRVRLSELPIRKQTARAIASIGALRRLLDLARADTILIGADGNIALKRSSHAK